MFFTMLYNILSVISDKHLCKFCCHAYYKGMVFMTWLVTEYRNGGN
jgi:hypothetical protein